MDRKFLLGLLTATLLIGPASLYESHELRKEIQLTRDHAASHEKELTALAAEHAEELTDGCNQSLVAAHSKEAQSVSQAIAGDGSRTILIDTRHPYPVNIGSAHVEGTPVQANIGVAWVIPRRIMPQVVDGVASARYGFVAPDGSFQGWYQPPSAH